MIRIHYHEYIFIFRVLYWFETDIYIDNMILIFQCDSCHQFVFYKLFRWWYWLSILCDVTQRKFWWFFQRGWFLYPNIGKFEVQLAFVWFRNGHIRNCCIVYMRQDDIRIYTRCSQQKSTDKISQRNGRKVFSCISIGGVNFVFYLLYSIHFTSSLFAPTPIFASASSTYRVRRHPGRGRHKRE